MTEERIEKLKNDIEEEIKKLESSIAKKEIILVALLLSSGICALLALLFSLL